MKKWPNFCNIWNLQANLGKDFSAKHIQVYIYWFFDILIILILWETNRGVHSNHIRQKKFKKTSLKWQKLPNFRNIWKIKAYFGKTFSLKYIKVYIIRKTILLGFHCAQFHENILFASGVIALLVTAYSIDWQIFGHFLPPLAQILNQI